MPVFRDDDGALLDEPYRLSLITAAAPNLRAILANQPGAATTVPSVVRARALRTLRVAAVHGHRRIVLGAWGCGVFGNDPIVVADAFRSALRHAPYFDRVAFAVLDRSPAARTYQAFVDTITTA